jgi:hypothetical protein
MIASRVLLVTTLSVAGCGHSPLPAWTSAQVGCPAEQIVVTKDEHVWTTRSWIARCQGKTYSCVEHFEGEPNAEISCREVGDNGEAPAGKDSP